MMLSVFLEASLKGTDLELVKTMTFLPKIGKTHEDRIKPMSPLATVPNTKGLTHTDVMR